MCRPSRFKNDPSGVERVNARGLQVGARVDLSSNQLLHVYSTMTVVLVFTSFKARKTRNDCLHDVPRCYVLLITKLHALQRDPASVSFFKAQINSIKSN